MLAGRSAGLGSAARLLEKAAELGGKVVMGPMDIPTVGRMAVIRDPQGAVLNVITYAG